MYILPETRVSKSLTDTLGVVCVRLPKCHATLFCFYSRDVHEIFKGCAGVVQGTISIVSVLLVVFPFQGRKTTVLINIIVLNEYV